MIRTDHLRIYWAVILASTLIAGTGCRQGNAAIRVEDKATNEGRTQPAVSASGSPEVSVVTGEPAIGSGDEETADDATTDNKLGAVAVKMQY